MLHLLLFVSAFICTVRCDFFSSTEELKFLTEEHQKLVDGISNLIVSLDTNVAYFKWKLETYVKDQNLMDNDVETFVSNPLNAFMLIKRLSVDPSQIEHFVYNSIEEFSKGLENLNLEQEELQGAVEGIERLQTTYNLKTNDLANGIIDSDDFNMTLSAYDLFVFGIELQKKEKYSRSIEYFVEALKKNQKHEDFNEVLDEEILTELILAYEIVGNYEKAILAVNDILQYNPDNVDVLLEYKASFEESLKLGVVEKFEELEETLEQKLTRKVCSGEMKRSSTELSKLHCRYESKNAFSFSPFKLEEVNHNPLIVVYHDVVSESEIEILKELAKPELKRSVTIKTTGELDKSNTRVSKVAWFEDEDHEVVSRISKRIELMTGLTKNAAEDLQIQQYGIGGFYDCHFDFSEQLKLEDKGDRIATTLLYLSNVEKGGQTVFPYLKARIFAEKGSAAFWYNLHDSGENDYRTRHSGCPVLVGSKWVGNKWFHERGQEQTRPCGKVFTSTDQLEVIDYQLYLTFES